MSINMRYSKAKEIIRTLREQGYIKYPGMGEYHFTLSLGDHHARHTLTSWEIENIIPRRRSELLTYILFNKIELWNLIKIEKERNFDERVLKRKAKH